MKSLLSTQISIFIAPHLLLPLLLTMKIFFFFCSFERTVFSGSARSNWMGKNEYRNVDGINGFGLVDCENKSEYFDIIRWNVIVHVLGWRTGRYHIPGECGKFLKSFFPIKNVSIETNIYFADNIFDGSILLVE